jgi:hypothetical protein
MRRDLLSPYQWHFDAAMTIEVWDGVPPAAEHEGWDHVVDVNLEVIGTPSREAYDSTGSPRSRAEPRHSASSPYRHPHPSSPRCSATPTTTPPDSSPRPAALGADTSQATTHGHKIREHATVDYASSAELALTMSGRVGRRA